MQRTKCLLAFVTLIVCGSTRAPAHAQQPYVRTWDRYDIERQQTCDRLLQYSEHPASGHSRCVTLRQMDSEGCFHIKGYPNLKSQADDCRKHGL